MNTTWLWVALPVAFLEWVAVSKGWKTLEYFAKPGVLVLLLAWLWGASGFQGQLAWFAAGLAFSLLGDILLLLSGRFFLAGVAAFLIAQLAYVAGFNASLPPVNLPSLILAGLVALTALRLYRTLARGLQSSGQDKLKIPVLLYSSAISLMLLSALITLVRPEWGEGPAWVVSAGALLFFVSDMLLAWEKFVHPARGRPLRIIISYHLGQGLIILGAALQYI